MKKETLRLFRGVAPLYDVMNDVLSLGLHRWWKERFIATLPWDTFPKSLTYIDMACGSGDIGSVVMRTAEARDMAVHAFFCDAVEAMLEMGKKRWEEASTPPPCHHEQLFRGTSHGAASSLTWIQCLGECTPFPENFFHLYTVSFGIRNMDHEKALQEAYRILKPGGTFACLEFSSPNGSFPVEYIQKIVPWMGERVAKNIDAYNYLSESILAFSHGRDILHTMEKIGFRHISHRFLCENLVTFSRGMK